MSVVGTADDITAIVSLLGDIAMWSGNQKLAEKAFALSQQIATPTPPPSRDADVERVEKVARIIDPAAFVGFERLEAYCVGAGDTPEEAKATAEWAHAQEIEKARDKARAALQALGERG